MLNLLWKIPNADAVLHAVNTSFMFACFPASMMARDGVQYNAEGPHAGGSSST